MSKNAFPSFFRAHSLGIALTLMTLGASAAHAQGAPVELPQPSTPAAKNTALSMTVGIAYLKVMAERCPLSKTTDTVLNDAGLTLFAALKAELTDDEIANAAAASEKRATEELASSKKASCAKAQRAVDGMAKLMAQLAKQAE